MMLECARAFSQSLLASTVIFLNGPLGAGKTTWVRGFLQGLGHIGKVKSPTYTLVETYDLDPTINHFDLYRITQPEELEFIGIREYFNPGAICLVEWPECGLGMLPEPDLILDFTVARSGRTLVIQANSARGQEILKIHD